jgi:ABC-type transporter Mla maintaining outer membrane lipid asymmetry ATPase subunit MlaF
MDALLELANVSKTVGKREILRNVTLRVGPRLRGRVSCLLIV